MPGGGVAGAGAAQGLAVHGDRPPGCRRWCGHPAASQLPIAAVEQVRIQGLQQPADHRLATVAGRGRCPAPTAVVAGQVGDPLGDRGVGAVAGHHRADRRGHHASAGGGSLAGHVDRAAASAAGRPPASPAHESRPVRRTTRRSAMMAARAWLTSERSTGVGTSMIFRTGHARPAATSTGASTPTSTTRTPYDFAGALDHNRGEYHPLPVTG